MEILANSTPFQVATDKLGHEHCVIVTKAKAEGVFRKKTTPEGLAAIRKHPPEKAEVSCLRSAWNLIKPKPNFRTMSRS